MDCIRRADINTVDWISGNNDIGTAIYLAGQQQLLQIAAGHQAVSRPLDASVLDGVIFNKAIRTLYNCFLIQNAVLGNLRTGGGCWCYRGNESF